MPKDVVLARELAEKLSAKYTGKIRKIEFTYDSYIELDNLPNDPVVWITLENSPLVREARGIVRRDASFTITMITEAGPTDDSQWIDDYILAFDSLLEFAMKTPVTSKQLLPIDMEAELRYDLERFHTHRRLVMDATLNYRNL